MPESWAAGVARTVGGMGVALRTNTRAVLDGVTLADIVDQDLPARAAKPAADPEAWTSH
jgi:hypothetical protein